MRATLRGTKFLPCPHCGAKLGVVHNDKTGDFHCIICARDWTRWTWPPAVSAYDSEPFEKRDEAGTS